MVAKLIINNGFCLELIEDAREESFGLLKHETKKLLNRSALISGIEELTFPKRITSGKGDLTDTRE